MVWNEKIILVKKSTHCWRFSVFEGESMVSSFCANWILILNQQFNQSSAKVQRIHKLLSVVYRKKNEKHKIVMESTVKWTQLLEARK